MGTSRVLRYGLLLLALTAFGVTLTAHYIFRAPLEYRANFYNADLFYLPDLISDLFEGGDLRLWHLSNTPYLFPDILFLALALALTRNPVLGVVLGGLAQVLLMAGGFTWLSARLYGRTIAAASLVCAALYFLALRHLTFSFELILFNGFHVGILAVLPYVLLLALGLIEGGWRPPAALMLAILVVLTTASDALFAVQVSAPLAASICLLAARQAVALRRAAALVALLGAGTVAGLALKPILLPTEPSLHRLDTLGALRVVAAQLAELVGLLPWLAVVWAAFMFLAVAELVRCYIRPTPPRDRYALVLGMIVLGIPITLLAMVVTGVTLERYMLNLLYLPTFFGWPLLFGLWHDPGTPPPRHAARRASVEAGAPTMPRPASAPSAQGRSMATLLVGAAALAVGLLGAPQLGAVAQLGHYTDHYTPLVACLDEQAPRYGLSRGITQYWHARLINLFSRQGLRAAQFQPNLAADYWTNSLAEYAQPFDFVVVEPPPHAGPFSLLPARVLDRFGPPDASFRCGNSEVYVYTQPEHALFHTFNQYSVLEHRIQPGVTLTLPGAALQGPLGWAEGTSRVSGPGQKGYLILDTLARLRSGLYRLELIYQGGGAESLGQIDVVARRDDGVEFELGEGLPLLGGPSRYVHLYFQLEERADVELQLLLNGAGSLRLEQLRVTQLAAR